MISRVFAVVAFVCVAATAQTTSLIASANEVAFGQPVTFVATIPGAGTTGKVTFTDNGRFLAAVPIAGTQAVVAFRLPHLGTRTIRASFNGSSAELAIRIVGARPGSYRESIVDPSGQQVLWRDLNGDGLLDKIALSFSVTGRIGFASLNVGNGTYGPAHLLPETRAVNALAFGDFTGDGRIDIVAALMDSRGLALMAGNGNGTFLAPTSLPGAPTLDSLPDEMHAEDFDNDGRTDLLVPNPHSAPLLLLQSTPGVMAPKSLPVSRFESVQRLRTGDTNGDGKSDFVIVHGSSTTSCTMFLSAGSSWVTGVTVDDCEGVELADFNGDGRADLLLGGGSYFNQQPHIKLRLAQADGSFGTVLPIEPRPEHPNAHAYALSTLDWNSDGKLDVLEAITLGVTPGERLRVRLGEGDGTFMPDPVDLALEGVYGLGYRYRLADLNGDAWPDLVGERGSWILTAVPQSPPAVSTSLDGFRFIAGKSANTFTLRVSDANTVQDVAKVYLLIGTDTSGAGACYLEYEPTTRLMRLRNDAGTAWSAPVLVESQPVQLANTQCEYKSFGTIPPTLTVPSTTFEMTVFPSQSFVGDKLVYAKAIDSVGNDMGFVLVGGISVAPGFDTPMTATVTPRSGTGQSGVFEITITDPDGQYDSEPVELSIGYLSGNANMCVVHVNLRLRYVGLYNDAGTAILAPDERGLLRNSQCTVNRSHVTFTWNAPNLKVAVPVTFADDYFGGFVQVFGTSPRRQLEPIFDGMWRVPPTVLVRSLTPASGSGASGVFTGLFQAKNGTQGLYLHYMLFLPTPNVVQYTAKGSCLVEYNRISNGIRLIDNPGTGWLGPESGVPISAAAQPLSNSVCTVNVAEVVIKLGVFDTEVRVPVTFKSGFEGVLGTFLQGFNSVGEYSGMTQFGSWIAFPRTRQVAGPAVQTSVLQQAGSSATLRATATHSSGIGALSMVSLLVGKSIMDRNPCQVIYFPWNNTLHLVNDDGTALVGGDAGVAIGAAQSLANSRCVVHPSLSTSSPMTGGVRIDVRLSFVGATFAGVKKAYAVAFDSGGLVTHWVDAGTLTVQ